MYHFQTHVFIIILAFMYLLFSLLRLKFPANLLVNLGLGNCLILKATWFVQTGYFLFTDFLLRRGGIDAAHPKEVNNHLVLQFISEAFLWHVLVIAASNLILWAFLSLIAKQRLCLRRRVRSREAMDEDENDQTTEKEEDENEEEMVDLESKKLISID